MYPILIILHVYARDCYSTYVPNSYVYRGIIIYLFCYTLSVYMHTHTHIHSITNCTNIYSCHIIITSPPKSNIFISLQHQPYVYQVAVSKLVLLTAACVLSSILTRCLIIFGLVPIYFHHSPILIFCCASHIKYLTVHVGLPDLSTSYTSPQCIPGTPTIWIWKKDLLLPYTVYHKINSFHRSISNFRRV